MNKKIMMPSRFELINDEEKSYIVGGFKINYNPTFLSKVGAMAFAASFKKTQNWNGISTYDLGAEIFFHAVLHYKGGQTVASILAKAGGKIGGMASKIVTSLSGGIDVENHRDYKKEMGIERWKIYDAFYVVGPNAF